MTNNDDNREIHCPYISSEFLAIFNDYVRDKKIKARTRQQYFYVICSLCNYTKCDFLDISASQINDYFKQLLPNEPLKSTNYDVSVLRAVARYIDETAEQYHILEGYLELFADLNIEFPDMQFELKDLPELSDIDTILEYFKNEGELVGFLACAMVLRTALTTNEMVKLKRDMFFQDQNGNYGVRFPISNYAYRFIKIPDDIAALITQYTNKRSDNNPSLFLNKKGKPISSRALQNRLRQACLSCHIKPFTYNDLRTLSQAIMIKDGAPLERIAQQINVKKLDWFFRYNRVVKELEDSAVDYMHIKINW